MHCLSTTQSEPSSLEVEVTTGPLITEYFDSSGAVASMGWSLRYTSNKSFGSSVNVTRNSRRLLSARTSNLYLSGRESKNRTFLLGSSGVSSTGSSEQRPGVIPAKSNQAQGRRLQLPGISPAGEQPPFFGLTHQLTAVFPSLHRAFCRG